MEGDFRVERCQKGRMGEEGVKSREKRKEGV